MSFNQHEYSPYLYVAGQAAQLERGSYYRQTINAWTLAGQVSNHKTNQQWSENRAAFCLRRAALQEESEEALREELKEVIPDDVPA